MDSGLRIGLPARGVYLPDLFHQALILTASPRRRALLPGIETGRTDAIEPAQRSHRERVLVVLDEGEDLRFRAEVNSMAFLKSHARASAARARFFILRSALSSAATSLSICTRLGHDHALARLLAPTRQHERVDVKRLGNILHC